MTPSQEE